jgi:hypothetical protein
MFASKMSVSIAAWAVPPLFGGNAPILAHRLSLPAMKFFGNFKSSHRFHEFHKYNDFVEI